MRDYVAEIWISADDCATGLADLESPLAGPQLILSKGEKYKNFTTHMLNKKSAVPALIQSVHSLSIEYPTSLVLGCMNHAQVVLMWDSKNLGYVLLANSVLMGINSFYRAPE